MRKEIPQSEIEKQLALCAKMKAEATGAHVLHAGTALDEDGDLVSSGGRVLAVVGTGTDLTAAREAAMAGVAKIELNGSFHRTDIALRAAEGGGAG